MAFFPFSLLPQNVSFSGIANFYFSGRVKQGYFRDYSFFETNPPNHWRSRGVCGCGGGGGLKTFFRRWKNESESHFSLLSLFFSPAAFASYMKYSFCACPFLSSYYTLHDLVPIFCSWFCWFCLKTTTLVSLFYLFTLFTFTIQCLHLPPFSPLFTLGLEL